MAQNSHSREEAKFSVPFVKNMTIFYRSDGVSEASLKMTDRDFTNRA